MRIWRANIAKYRIKCSIAHSTAHDRHKFGIIKIAAEVQFSVTGREIIQ